MKEIKGDLIQLAKEKYFDIIGHGCNCFNTMGSGIARQIKENFPHAFMIDQQTERGDIRKLGDFSYAFETIGERKVIPGEKVDYRERIIIVNIYSQYTYNPYDKPIDYEALTLALRKINHLWPRLDIGLPLIGAGLAGGDWNRIKSIIEKELKDMNVTIVHYDG
jgi:O-acetyl-ADP-ribose deacetylase (regulator of RNase III)